MTRQKALDRNWTHFVTDQHPKCMLPSGHCTYGTPDGQCCGIGILFSPELRGTLQNCNMPVDRLEGLLARLAPHCLPEYLRLVQECTMPFLLDLQAIHDNIVTDQDTLDQWPAHVQLQPFQFMLALERLAARWGLVCPG